MNYCVRTVQRRLRQRPGRPTPTSSRCAAYSYYNAKPVFGGPGLAAYCVVDTARSPAPSSLRLQPYSPVECTCGLDTVSSSYDTSGGVTQSTSYSKVSKAESRLSMHKQVPRPVPSQASRPLVSTVATRTSQASPCPCTARALGSALATGRTFSQDQREDGTWPGSPARQARSSPAAPTSMSTSLCCRHSPHNLLHTSLRTRPASS